MNSLPEKTIVRFSLYRRLLRELRIQGRDLLFSHELAKLAQVSAAQVRRDIMSLGYSGSPVRGYEIAALIDGIEGVLDRPEGQCVALVGIGNLGRAILDYFGGRRPNLKITAAFDQDPNKAHRVIHNCRCYPMESLQEILTSQNIQAAIITVPAAQAQKVADQLVSCGVKGILNFAPVLLHVPEGVFVEDMDISMSLEKVAYFSRCGAAIVKSGYSTV